MIKSTRFTNANPCHPGAVLREDYLRASDIDVEEFAEHSGIPLATVRGLVEERLPFTHTLALQVTKYFGGKPEDAEGWVRMQDTYNLNKPAQKDALHTITPQVVAVDLETASLAAPPRDYWVLDPQKVHSIALEGLGKLPDGGFKPGDLTTYGAPPPRGAAAYRASLSPSTVAEEGLRDLAKSDGKDPSNARAPYTVKVTPLGKPLGAVSKPSYSFLEGLSDDAYNALYHLWLNDGNVGTEAQFRELVKADPSLLVGRWMPTLQPIGIPDELAQRNRLKRISDLPTLNSTGLFSGSRAETLDRLRRLSHNEWLHHRTAILNWCASLLGQSDENKHYVLKDGAWVEAPAPDASSTD